MRHKLKPVQAQRERRWIPEVVEPDRNTREELSDPAESISPTWSAFQTKALIPPSEGSETWSRSTADELVWVDPSHQNMSCLFLSLIFYLSLLPSFIFFSRFLLWDVNMNGYRRVTGTIGEMETSETLSLSVPSRLHFLSVSLFVSDPLRTQRNVKCKNSFSLWNTVEPNERPEGQVGGGGASGGVSDFQQVLPPTDSKSKNTKDVNTLLI